MRKLGLALFVLTILAILIAGFNISKLLAAPIVVFKPKQTIRIEGTIKNLVGESKIVDKLSKEHQDIYLIINSGGGNVAAGMSFMNAMNMAKERGSEIICFVPTFAASMAFSILNECTQRYSFEYSMLMWHPMKIGGMFAMFSADEMEYLIKLIRAWEVPLIARLLDELKIDRETFYYHYAKETTFTALQLRKLAPHYITIVRDIGGVDNVFGTK